MIGCEWQPSLEEELFNAIFYNNRLKVLSILDSGFDINITNNLGQTPIYVAAAIYKNLLMVKTLASFNPDFEHKSDLGHTPLSRILLGEHKHADEVLKIIRTLLKSGAKLTTRCNGALPLHIAIVTGCHTDIIKELLTEDTVNAADYYGYFPLHLAVLYSHINIVKMLIEYEYTNINMSDRVRNTPLILAAKIDNQEIAYLLLGHGVNPYLKNTDGEDFLACIIPKGKVCNIIHGINEFRVSLEALGESGIESKNKLNIDPSKPGPYRTKIFRTHKENRPYIIPDKSIRCQRYKSIRYQRSRCENEFRVYLPNCDSPMLQVVQHEEFNNELNTDPSRTPLNQLTNMCNESLELPRPDTVLSRSTTSNSSYNSSLATKGSSNVNSPGSGLSYPFITQFESFARISSTSSSESDTMQNAKRRKLDCTFSDNGENLERSR
ncbi:ankyrin repeat domain-containing protein [Candidatus Mesenet endosymbiont of Phosphuga atrata]|uniref:ankyrin repeat domain-containing protein n=1 Tax=Candidatus Mesenet endosymbiont of Phosphuga atrata TaxID=3066221 RepID=UPI0030CABF55